MDNPRSTTTNGGPEASKDFYTFKLEKEPSAKKTVSFKTIVFLQLFILGVFVVGLVIGLIVGIYAYKDQNKQCQGQHESPQAQLQHQTSHPSSDSTSTPSPSHNHHHHHSTDFLTHSPLEFVDDGINVNNFEEMPDYVDSTTDKPKEPEKACSVCKQRQREPPVNDKKPVFAPLTVEEMNLTHDILRENAIINLEINKTNDLKTDFLHAMQLSPPNKKKALAYLDSNGTFPGRYASVSINKGAADPPFYMEYTVGPLDGPRENITIKPMLDPDEVPYSRRPYDIFEIELLMVFIFREIGGMRRLIQESFDTSDAMDDLNVIPVGPFESEEGKRISRFSLSMRGLGNRDMDFLSSLPLSGKINHESLNTSDWYIYDYYYMNQGPFPNSSFLYSAYVYDMITKIRFPSNAKDRIQQMAFPQRDEHALPRENSHFPGPKTYETSGPRYKISGHDISWLGWTLSASSSTLRGPSIFNVKFQNERILYENSLNDIGLVYSADDPGKDNVVYNDAEYGIGNAKHPMMGIDCPEHATLLNVSSWLTRSGKASVVPGICVFEQDNQEPLWRHDGIGFQIGIRNRYLVVRYPTRIGNYDYIFDFEFHLDGRIKTKAIATGFLFGSFHDPYTLNFGGPDGRTPFGYKIGSFITGPIHDHTFGFKVDLDIVGPKNNFEVINWKAGDVSEAVNSYRQVNVTPPYFHLNQTRYIEWDFLKNEDKLNINLVNQTFWTVVNNQERNAWNVSRGYRIMTMATGTQNLDDSYPMMGSIAFTKHQCHITKRKENEPYMKPIYKYSNNKSSRNVKRYLQDMVDGESIDNEDLVTWLSVGFLHIPTSEDVPITSRVETGFILKPFNFFENTMTYDIPQYTKVADKVFDTEPTEEACYVKS
ncbi:amiloride-sensitive amine oxidase [copper-containing]-like [Pecten maximus]|uniref:amiloride-sensitive amine oxidase [copper-containing]-like n=1 Tax=Pecten maximus TaxID=6579 RepID=UPI0014587977|nr:amiloride-sensitive amine oxidase [copper-containing]-like [Pecten maximus]